MSEYTDTLTCAGWAGWAGWVPWESGLLWWLEETGERDPAIFSFSARKECYPVRGDDWRGVVWVFRSRLPTLSDSCPFLVLDSAVTTNGRSPFDRKRTFPRVGFREPTSLFY